MRFSDLQDKDVINVCDGRNLGKTDDLEIDCAAGQILALVVVDNPKGWSFFKSKSKDEGVVVPWHRIVRIGDDAILVELDSCFIKTRQADDS